MMSYLEAQRALTIKYIEYDPTEIVLIPYVDTPSATGGFTRTEGVPKAPQTFKRIAQSSARPIVTVAGVERIVDYVLLGAWDSNMEVGDHWTDPQDGAFYEVIAIEAGHGYERKGFVARKLTK
jgi:hypothetical protein